MNSTLSASHIGQAQNLGERGARRNLHPFGVRRQASTWREVACRIFGPVSEFNTTMVRMVSLL